MQTGLYRKYIGCFVSAACKANLRLVIEEVIDRLIVDLIMECVDDFLTYIDRMISIHFLIQLMYLIPVEW